MLVATVVLWRPEIRALSLDVWIHHGQVSRVDVVDCGAPQVGAEGDAVVVVEAQLVSAGLVEPAKKIYKKCMYSFVL